jgi:hypothetical protein
MKFGTLLLVSAAALIGTLTAAEPKELAAARKEFAALKNPTEEQRVKYLTSLVRMREKLTRADDAAIQAIDTELIKHPMPAKADAKALKKLLVGRWQSPRRPYFYHADGTYAANEDNAENAGGTWRIEGNKFFQTVGNEKAEGDILFLLTDKDFVYGAHVAPFYLRRGTAFPWK